MTQRHDLSEILGTLDPQAPMVQRHLWLISFFEWLRGDCTSVRATLARLTLFLDNVEARPELTTRAQAWWQTLLATVDGTALLADYGFSSRSAFVTELADRIRLKILPGTPETADASALFTLALCHSFDARWLTALDEPTLARLAHLMQPQATQVTEAAGSDVLTPWHQTLLEAITFCASQISAAGF